MSGGSRVPVEIVKKWKAGWEMAEDLAQEVQVAWTTSGEFYRALKQMAEDYCDDINSWHKPGGSGHWEALPLLTDYLEEARAGKKVHISPVLVQNRSEALALWEVLKTADVVYLKFGPEAAPVTRAYIAEFEKRLFEKFPDLEDRDADVVE